MAGFKAAGYVLVALLSVTDPAWTQEIPSTDRDRKIRQAIADLDHDDPAARDEATRALVELDANKEVAPLIHSDNPEVRARARRALPLLEFLQLAPTLKRRWKEAPHAFSDLTAQNQLAILTKEMGACSDEERKNMVAWSWREDSRVQEHFRQAEGARQTKPGTKKTREDYEYAQGHLRVWWLFYVGALRSEKAGLREKAASVMGRVAAATTEKNVREEIAKALWKALEDEEAGVRASAAVTMSRVPTFFPDGAPPEFVRSMIQCLRDETPRVRSGTCTALGRGGILLGRDEILFSEGVEGLLERLSDSEKEVRAAAAGALGEIASLLNGELLERVISAVEQLRKTDEKESYVPLLELLLETLHARKPDSKPKR